jgi:SAM-dependent methyltransferase
VKALRDRLQLSQMTLIHFSPERALQPHFREIFANYRTAGIWSEPVDFPADLTALPFKDGSCDCIFASHVLEHRQDDNQALAEIRRVLRPGGVAILPVPIVEPQTIEYGVPNPGEAGHVRAPGLDYYERYRRHFPTIEIWDSTQFPEEFQLFNIEDRTGFPTALSPLRTPMTGDRHADFVPVCIA